MVSSLSPRSSSAAAASGDVAATRTVTDLDHVRLSSLVRRHAAPVHGAAAAVEALLDAIGNADVVAPQEIAANVVTMKSRVLVEDGESRERRELTLCYPEDADPPAGQLSVLSPVGASLLGLSVGDTACWQTPDGARGSAKIVEVLFQPEASGDFLA